MKTLATWFDNLRISFVFLACVILLDMQSGVPTLMVIAAMLDARLVGIRDRLDKQTL